MQKIDWATVAAAVIASLLAEMFLKTVLKKPMEHLEEAYETATA